ncbi:MAG: hypothetical protein IJD68_02505 [Ruminococcus sp.]|nr:hypothetical protein [Ruminococcus sp.]
MKKIICIFLSMLMVFSLTACTEKTEKEEPIITQESTENESIYPSPTSVTWEKSENNLGARYIFTLEEFTDMLNERCEGLGETETTQFFEMDNWKKMSETLVDDNGIEYTSYYYATDALTITAAVENESEKVLNLGCGTAYTEFVNSDADYQYTVMLTSAILAMVAGGYEDDDLEFLYYIFFDSAKTDTAFFYNNSVYMLNLSKEKGEKDAALLFMISPCKDEILEEWELTDYSKFEASSVNA